MIEIKNMPPYHKKYIVANAVVDAKDEHIDYWFYQSWDSEEKAYEKAREVGAQVFVREP